MTDYSSHIGIIGGGIAGLTAGCALRLQGIETVVFERAHEISEYGAGISISPNALRLLKKLDIKDELIKSSFIPKSAVFNHLNKKLRDIHTEVVTSSRQKLIQVIYNKYIELGGEVIFEHEYVNLNQDTCEISFNNGHSYVVKHILACDGIRSSIRQQYFSSSGEPVYSGYSAWRGIGLSSSKQVQFYFGPGSHIVSYPIDDEGRTSFVGVIKTKESAGDSWKMKGSKADLLEDFKNYDENVFSILDSSADIYKWDIYVRPPLKSMCTKNITLLGDAAHPMVPFLGQGGCMAIEDAYTFAALAGRSSSDYKNTQILYQKIRLKRNNKIHATSMMQGKLNHIENSVLVFLRNLILKYTPIISIRLRGIWDYDVDEEIKQL
jgi:salicylate hydroxylase|tara:strand:- start:8544 stop:9680 length:1137 start_codon:yes stop_codon:yes gene_type:complete